MYLQAGTKPLNNPFHTQQDPHWGSSEEEALASGDDSTNNILDVAVSKTSHLTPVSPFVSTQLLCFLGSHMVVFSSLGKKQ